MSNIIIHPTINKARSDREQARENLARQLRANQMMRESARERINASQLVDEIHELDLNLRGGYTEATKMVVDPVTKVSTIVTYEIPVPLEREIISALKARVDIKFRLLNKVLPDLKSTESISHNVHDHQHIISPVSNIELATRLQLWQRDIKSRKPLPMPEEQAVTIIDIESTKDIVESVVEDTLLEYDWL